jgi:hypothetical protein
VRAWREEHGSALLVALLMLMAMAFCGAALVMTASSDLKVAGEERRGVQAEFVAEAGVQEALHRLSLASGTTITVDGRTFDPSIRDSASPLDPGWEARVFASNTTPASSGSIHYTPTVQSGGNRLAYSSGSEYVSVRHKWQDLDGDGVRDANEIVLYDSNKFPPENFDSGSPVEVIDVQGHHGEARRRLRVECTRFPFAPNVLAALSSDRGVDVRGNVCICGHDHRASIPTGTDLSTNPPCSPNYDQAEGHRPAITTTGDPVDRRGSSDLLGDPTATDTSSTNPFYTLAQALGVTQDVLDQVLAGANHHSSHDGSPLNGITYIDGDATGGEKFNNVTGDGLLYVRGDLDVSGSFVWRGLIYVEGDFKITGTPWILGGIWVRGRSDYAFSGGAPAILYSSEQLRLSLESAFEYIILSWKEM